MTIINLRAAGFALLLAGIAPVLAGCNEPKDAVAAAPAAPETEVSVVTVKQQARAIVRELPGRIAPTRVADVRSRVSGIIIERAFHQGTEVKAGDTLYRIDPKPFEVELQAAKASLNKAEAAFDLAATQAKRISGLAQQRAVSEAEGERAIGAERQAQAEIAARKADVARARLNLDYATIRAPIDGIVGAALVTEGTLIAQNDTTNLATIQQLDPIYADFTQSVSELNNLRRSFETGDLERIAPDAAKVRLRVRRRLDLSAGRQAAVLGSQGGYVHRPGDPARRIPESEARTAAWYVCPRADRAGHRHRRHRRSAAGRAAQWRRRRRSVRGQERRPCRRAGGQDRCGAGWSVVRDGRSEGGRANRRRGLPEVHRR